jgi:hypothetical protein
VERSSSSSSGSPLMSGSTSLLNPAAETDRGIKHLHACSTRLPKPLPHRMPATLSASTRAESPVPSTCQATRIPAQQGHVSGSASFTGSTSSMHKADAPSAVPIKHSRRETSILDEAYTRHSISLCALSAQDSTDTLAAAQAMIGQCQHASLLDDLPSPLNANTPPAAQRAVRPPSPLDLSLLDLSLTSDLPDPRTRAEIRHNTGNISPAQICTPQAALDEGPRSPYHLSSHLSHSAVTSPVMYSRARAMAGGPEDLLHFVLAGGVGAEDEDEGSIEDSDAALMSLAPHSSPPRSCASASSGDEVFTSEISEQCIEFRKRLSSTVSIVEKR